MRSTAAYTTRSRTPGGLALLLTLLFFLAGCRPIPDPAAMAAPQPTEAQQAEEPTAEPPTVQESRAARLLREDAPELLWRYQPEQPEVAPKGYPPLLARALIGGTVYVGAMDGYIHALHADSGERLWSYQAGGNVGADPVQVGGSVFFGSEDGNLYALDSASGELLWRHETDDPIVNVVAEEGLLYVDTSFNHIYALNPVSREEIWHFWSDTAGYLPLRTVAEGVVYAGLSDNLFALDAASGEPLWQFPPLYFYPALEVDGGVVYFTGIREYTRSYVYALDAGSGQQLWRIEIKNLVIAPPVVADGVVYLASNGTDWSAYDSIFYALDSKTGEELWRYESGTKNNSSPLVVEDVLYGGADGGHQYALDAKTGEELWRFQERQTEFFLDGFIAIPAAAVIDGVAYFGKGSDFILAWIVAPERSFGATSRRAAS